MMNKKSNESYSQYCKRIENNLIRRKKIKLAGINRIIINRRLAKGSDIIYRILYLSYTHGTIYTHNNKVQCCNGCRRSQGDLFLLARHYYPEITFEKVRSWLAELIKEGKISANFCRNINKRVFYIAKIIWGNSQNELDNQAMIYADMIYDEYGFIYR